MRRAVVLALLVATVIKQLVVDDFLLEDLAVVRELGEHERVDVALALDRRVAVDRERLRAGDSSVRIRLRIRPPRSNSTAIDRLSESTISWR